MNKLQAERKNKLNIKTVLLWTAGVAAFLGLWQAAPRLMGKSGVLLATPVKVAERLFQLFGEPGFFARVWFSLARIALGFFIALAAGIILASLSARFKVAEAFISPYITVAKTVPVASFIVLAFIWLSSNTLSVFISFLIVLPVIYTNTLDGIRAADKQLLEAASVFKVSAFRRVFYIYIPALRPYLLAGSRVGVGMAWKSGVAAEVIGVATGSIGEKIYSAKAYFDSAELLAWTAVLVAVSVAFELLFILLLKLAFKGVKKL